MEATISVTLKRDDGVTISRDVTVRTSIYDKKQTQAAFKAKAKRRATEALNAVFGTPSDVSITKG